LRIAVIGCGHVGVTCAHALLQSRLCREIVLVDEDQERVRGEALDLLQATPLDTPVKIYGGDHKDAAASEIVILTVGAPGKFSGSRLDLLAGNVGIVRSCVGKLMAENFAGTLLVATNPVDILTFVAQNESGLPLGRVVGSGTLIDTLRLRSLLGEKLRVDPRSVHVQVIGEHGDSSVAVWSAAQVSGLPLALYPGADALPPQEGPRQRPPGGPRDCRPQRQHVLRDRGLRDPHLRGHRARRAFRPRRLDPHDRPIRSS